MGEILITQEIEASPQKNATGTSCLRSHCLNCNFPDVRRNQQSLGKLDGLTVCISTMRHDSCIDAFEMTMIYIIILLLPTHCWKPKRNAREKAHDNINNILAAIARMCEKWHWAKYGQVASPGLLLQCSAKPHSQWWAPGPHCHSLSKDW